MRDTITYPGDFWEEYDSVPIKFQSLKNPKARKEHRCTDCARAILPGEQYEYHAFMRYCDDLRIEKRCAECIGREAPTPFTLELSHDRP